MATQLWDRFSATIHLDVSEPQPQHGLLQFNARRDASNELVSCDVRRSEFIDAIRREFGMVVIDTRDYAADILANLITAIDGAGHVTLANDLREAITPPRIPEPGLWGVVEAVLRGDEKRARLHYIRTDAHTWTCVGGARRSWTELIDPALIREGVES